MIKKKFDSLLESNLSRLSRGGYLAGDFVVIKKGLQSSKEFKEYISTNKDLEAKIKEWQDGDCYIRVKSVDDLFPVKSGAFSQNSNGLFTVKLAKDYGGGRLSQEEIVLPISFIDKDERVTDNNYYPAWPASATIDSKQTLKPVEVDFSGSNNTGFKNGDYNLPS
jgi:hypothetical protein